MNFLERSSRALASSGACGAMCAAIGGAIGSLVGGIGGFVDDEHDRG